MIRRLAALALFLALPPGAAGFEPDGWAGGVSRDAAGGILCSVGTSFESGLDLHLALDEARFTLFLAHGGWRLDNGVAWPVTLSLDGTLDVAGERLVARAVDTHMVGIALARDWLDRLRAGKVLRLGIGGRALAFDLVDLRPGLDALEACAASGGEPPAQ